MHPAVKSLGDTELTQGWYPARRGLPEANTFLNTYINLNGCEKRGLYYLYTFLSFLRIMIMCYISPTAQGVFHLESADSELNELNLYLGSFGHFTMKKV